MSEKVYAGVGPRSAPDDIVQLSFGIGWELARRGFHLRTCGASEMDDEFLSGVTKDRATVYLPWRKFRDSLSLVWMAGDRLTRVQAHPVWGMIREHLAIEDPPVDLDGLKPGVQLLYAAQMYAVLGDDLNQPAARLITWSWGGRVMGDKRIALYTALSCGVPVQNLFDFAVRDQWHAVLQQAS